MKLLSDFIFEKLHPSKFKKQEYTFEIVSNPDKYLGYNWILDYKYIYTSKTLLQYALDHAVLRDQEKDFINEFLEEINEYFDKNGYDKLSIHQVQITKILNGQIEDDYYQRPKCIYDICKYFLKNDSEPETYEDEDGNLIFDDVNHIIKSLDTVTNGRIKNLDWVHE